MWSGSNKTWFISCSCSAALITQNEPSQYGSGYSVVVEVKDVPGETSAQGETQDSFPPQTASLFAFLSSLGRKDKLVGYGKNWTFSVCIHK